MQLRSFLGAERRSETRAAAERYYSVQFTTEGLASVYQFKLWNISSKGMCILVKEGLVVALASEKML